MMSPEEVQILTVERKLMQVERGARELRQALAAIRQGLDETYGAVAQTAVTCIASLSGKIAGCDGTTGLPGVVVTVAVAAGGAVLGAFTSDAGGNYAGSVTLPTGTSTFCTCSVPAMPGYQALSFGTTLNCGTNTLSTHAMVLATNYVCKGGRAIPKTLYFTDSVETLVGTYDPVQTRWFVGSTLNLTSRVASGINNCTIGAGQAVRNYQLTFSGATPILVEKETILNCSGTNALCPPTVPGNAFSTTGTLLSVAYGPFVGQWNFPSVVNPGAVPVAVFGTVTVTENP